MHGKAAQPQAEQQPGHGHVPRHFAADADALALGIAYGNRVSDQAQHGRMTGVVQVRDGLIRAVDGQRVLR